MNTVSPTGMVHAIESQDDWGIITLCHHCNGPSVSYFELDWPETDDPVTCKRCLLNMGTIKTPQQELAECKAALEYYANPRNYQRVPLLGFEGSSPVEVDRGERAQKALGDG